MNTSVNLYSNKSGEIKRFLKKFYDGNISISEDLKWTKYFDNPIEICDILGVFIDNHPNFSINMWISLDRGVLIHVSDDNANEIIKYLYERFPY